uniref:MAPEG family protein n=1 Tax=uncultured Sphingomonas sp. TaxID=158754 RepID=UPI0025E0EDE1|nr:MAPEG family protein [uncultured Sphingomonas sp.]
MPHSPLLGPVVALVAWTLVMLFWMAIVRGLAARRAGINLTAKRGGRGQQLEGVLPDGANWPAHNYMHLMEQPTIFYAIVFALILMDFDAPINVWLAWGYVAFRVLHSLVQATFNDVRVRFPLFFLSSLCLISLTVHAALRLWH